MDIVDLQAKYQTLASEYSKVRMYFYYLPIYDYSYMYGN